MYILQSYESHMPAAATTTGNGSRLYSAIFLLRSLSAGYLYTHKKREPFGI